MERKSLIEIKKVSITDTGLECVVNAANSGLWKGSGVCGYIFNAAGSNELADACNAIGHCNKGSAVITPGFNLSKYIIHAIGPVWNGGNNKEPQKLYGAYKRSLELCKENNIHEAAFPLISAGIFGYPVDKAWRKALQACRDFINNNLDYDIKIVFAVLDDQIIKVGKDYLDEISHQMVVTEPTNINDNLVMDKYNDFIIERLNINNIEESKSILKNLLDEDEFTIINLIIFKNKPIVYAGRVLGLSNGKIRHRFFNILRKIGRTRHQLSLSKNIFLVFNVGNRCIMTSCNIDIDSNDVFSKYIIWVYLKEDLKGMKIANIAYIRVSSVDQNIVMQEETFKSLKEGDIDTTTATGKLVFNIFASLAEFERETIKERQAEGIAVAKAKGKYKGRARRQIDETKFNSLMKRWEDGEIKKKFICKELNISMATLDRRMAEHKGKKKHKI